MFRDIIDQYLPRYVQAGSRKASKSSIVAEIMQIVRSVAPAGFVRYCDVEQLWYEIGDDAASK